MVSDQRDLEIASLHTTIEALTCHVQVLTTDIAGLHDEIVFRDIRIEELEQVIPSFEPLPRLVS